MDPIKLYFAANVPKKLAEQMVSTGVKNRLVSYAYPKEFYSWMSKAAKKGDVIIDSGAFSAWNKGEVLDIHSYIEYAHKAIDFASAESKVNIHVVNLDVIPGAVGETAALNRSTGPREILAQNKALIEESAQRGFDNMLLMKKEGITPIHVFHQGEDWKWLEKMVEHTDYIGISPANDMSPVSKKRWIYSVFEYMYKRNIKVKTHGFAVWIFDIMKDLPWTSCDAATWKLMAGMGKIYVPNKGYENIDFSKGTSSFTVIRLSDRVDEIKGMRESIKVLETTGFSYQQLLEHNMPREIANTMFFLAMEKWLNNYKKTHEYKPINKLV